MKAALQLLGARAFPGVVTEDGVRLLPDRRADLQAHYAQFAGQAVDIYVVPQGRPITADARGYWWAVLVRLYAEHVAEPSMLVAHFQLLRLVDWVPGEAEPTTSDAGSDGAQMSDRIERAIAFLTGLGLDVPEAEPDPRVRLEQQRPRHLRRVS
jgi:hypothetical protein